MDKARLISFLRVQTDKPTDTILESSNGNMSEQRNTQKNQLNTYNKEIAVNRYMHPR